MNRKLVITGSRAWTCGPTIEAWLRTVPKSVAIIHGGCPVGADRFVDVVARKLGFIVFVFPVDLEKDGPWPAAGPKRNERMLTEAKPGRVWAFRVNGKSNGTDDCVRRALLKLIPTTTIPEGSRP